MLSSCNKSTTCPANCSCSEMLFRNACILFKISLSLLTYVTLQRQILIKKGLEILTGSQSAEATVRICHRSHFKPDIIGNSSAMTSLVFTCEKVNYRHLGAHSRQIYRLQCGQCVMTQIESCTFRGNSYTGGQFCNSILKQTYYGCQKDPNSSTFTDSYFLSVFCSRVTPDLLFAALCVT